jgi:hypothetical protein
MHFGNVIHEVIEQVYAYYAPRRDIDTLEQVTTDAIDSIGIIKERDLKRVYTEGSTYPEEAADITRNCLMAEPIIRGYLNQWWEEDRKRNWNGFETVFRVEYETEKRLGLASKGNYPNIPVNGKIDRSHWTNAGKLSIWDTKTKGRIETGNISDRLAIDSQVFLYTWASSRHYGTQPTSAYYDIIRRPQLKQKQTESLPEFVERIREAIAKEPEHYYIRFESAINAVSLRAWEKRLDAAMRRLIQWYEGFTDDWENPWHYLSDGACFGAGFT